MNCQSQSVVISSTKSRWRPVPSAVHLVWIVGPKLFNIVINDLYDESECPFRKYVDDPKLRGVVGAPGGRFRGILTGWRNGKTGVYNEVQQRGVQSLCISGGRVLHHRTDWG